MWCTSCRQDVPGIASTIEGHYCCARCSEVLLRDRPVESVGIPKLTTTEDSKSEPNHEVEPSASDRLADLRFSSLPSIDDWELDEQLKHVERMLVSFRPPSARKHNPSSIDAVAVSAMRVDDSVEKPAQPPVAPTTTTERPRSVWSLLVWLLVAASWTALACGGALTGWGWYIHRDDFWNLGLPILFGGQLGLLVGLTLQLMLTLRAARSKQPVSEAAPEPVRPAMHSASPEVDQRFARMQRQLDGFTQRFDPSGK